MNGYSFEFLSKCVIWRNLLHYLPAVLVVCLLASPVMTQERRVLTEQEIGLSCTFSKDRSWEDLVAYADQIEVEMGSFLRQIVCRMSESTADNYSGNIWEASARYSGFVADIVKFSTRYLLKDKNEHELFVTLVIGSNVPDAGLSYFPYSGKEGGVFRELRDAWEIVPAKRLDLQIAARAICLSIDRYNVQGLDDIRANECMTPPFVFPPLE